MTEKFYSWLSPKLESGPFHHKGGCGVITRQPVSKGELLVLWGGRFITAAELDPTIPEFSKLVLQVDDELYLYNPLLNDPADCFNHSCDPNAGMSGQVGVVAMRDIPVGEEVTIDYAMCDSAPYDEFDCNCGMPHCRKRVTADDWKRSELQERYMGYFSTYLQRKIDALRASRSD